MAISLLGLVVFATPGCAPLNASTAIGEAESAEDQAKLAMAHRNAPYEFYMAKAYLHKAKKTDGYSEYNISEIYAKRARGLYAKAVQQARENVMRLKVLQQRTKKGTK